MATNNPTHSLDVLISHKGTMVKLGQCSMFANQDLAQSLIMALEEGELDIADLKFEVSGLKKWGEREVVHNAASEFDKK